MTQGQILNCQVRGRDKTIDLFIYFNGMSTHQGYFKPGPLGITFVVRSYLHFCVLFLVGGLFLLTVRLNGTITDTTTPGQG